MVVIQQGKDRQGRGVLADVVFSATTTPLNGARALGKFKREMQLVASAIYRIPAALRHHSINMSHGRGSPVSPAAGGLQFGARLFRPFAPDPNLQR